MNAYVTSSRRIWLFPLAALLCTVPPFRQHVASLLATWKQPEIRTSYQRLVYPAVLLFWTRFVYRREKDPERREALQALVWGQGSGGATAERWDTLPVDVQLAQTAGGSTYSERIPLLRYLDGVLETAAHEVLICQIGSSSGREIAWLARRRPRHTYLGTDISPEAVEHASARYSSHNLTFRICSAREIGALLRDKESARGAIVFSHGCLQHVQPEHVGKFFAELGGIANVLVALAEPVNRDDGAIEEFRGSRYRGSVSYSHNYRFYAEAAGFVTEASQMVTPI